MLNSASRENQTGKFVVTAQLLGCCSPNQICAGVRRTEPTTRLVRPVKTQVSLCICTVWSVSLLIVCAFYSLQTIQRGINENPCYTWLKYRLIWVLAGHTGLIVSFVMSWLIYHHSQNMKIVIAPHKALISTGMHWYFSYFSPTKHILWVLVRSALLRYFYWVPTTISQRNKISYST